MATLDEIKTEISKYYETILQRAPSDEEVSGWASPVSSGALTIDQVRKAFIDSPEAQHVAGVVRLYQAAFDRVPDEGGLKAWVQSGLSLEQIADGFASSEEFTNRYGTNPSREAFVTSLYYQVLGRAPDAGGLAAWTNSGQSFSEMLAGFGKSEEFQIKTTAAVTTFLDEAGKGIQDYSGKLVDYTPAPEPEVPGQTFALTQSVDPIVGTDGADTINGLLNIDGINTLNALDSIDGGNGVDTLNISIGTGANSGVPVSASIKNVEIINLVSDGGKLGSTVDASRFVGAEQIWQIDAANNVTKLASGTTAGFKGIVADDAANLKVSAAATAASVSIALDNVVGEAGTNVSELSVEGAALNSVMISGSLALAEEGEPEASLALGVTVGKDASGKVLSTLTVNTSVDTSLTVTGAISTLAAGESIGGISYTGAPTVSSITTGSGDDNVSINFVTSKATSTVAAKDASVYTADGDDTISISDANGTGTTKVDAGHGDNTIIINGNTSADAKMEVISGDGIDIVNVVGRSGTVNLSVGKGDDEITLGTGYKALTVDTGEGDDSVTLSSGLGSLKTGYSVDGGDGIDTVVVAGKILLAADYVALNDVLKNFEAVEFTGGPTTIDASRVNDYKTLILTDGEAAARATLLIAQGANTQAQTDLQLAQGANTQAQTDFQLAQGANTQAQTDLQLAQGANTQAQTDLQLAQSAYTQAQANLVIDPDDPAFIIAATSATSNLNAATSAATSATSNLNAATSAATSATSNLNAATSAATSATSNLNAATSAASLAAAALTSAENAVTNAQDSIVTEVGADQELIAKGDLDATAKGYVVKDGVTTHEGALNITVQANFSTVTAKAQSVDLKVDASDIAGVDATLKGDVKTATVTLTNSQVLNAEKEVVGDTYAHLDVTASSTELKNMNELTLSGSGSASVTNADGSMLTMVDASALGGSVTYGENEGDALQGLTYETSNTAAETVKLGSGIDRVFFDTDSTTVLKTDTIEGLNLVADEDGELDVAASDMISLSGNFGEFKVAEEVTGSTLNLVLKNLAESSTTDDTFVFQFDGNTYAFADLNDDTISDTDVLVKIVGTVDSELLAASLNHNWA